MNHPLEAPKSDSEFRTGRVRAIFHQKGYGFARSFGQDIFFHMNSFKNEEDFFDCEPASKIKFNLFDTDRGKQAGDIEIVPLKGK